MPTPIDLQQMFADDPELRQSIANTTSSDPNTAHSELSKSEREKVTQSIKQSSEDLAKSLPQLPSAPSVPQMPSASGAATRGLDKIKSLLPNPANFIVIPTFFGSDLIAGAINDAVKQATDAASAAAKKAGEAAKEASEKAESRINKAKTILDSAEMQGQVNEIRATTNNRTSG